MNCYLYICTHNTKQNKMKKVRSVNLDDETIEKLKRIGYYETGSHNISAAIRVLVKNYKEK